MIRRPSVETVLGHPVYMAVGVILTLVIVGSIADPHQAAALPLPTNPADLLNADKIIPGGLNPTQWPVEGFKAIVTWAFGDVDQLGKSLVNLLLAVPLLTDHKVFPKLNDYRDYITGASWGLLGLSLVVSSLRYWLASYSGNGAYEALQGFARTSGSIVMLLIFVPFYDQLSRIVNALTSALVTTPLVHDGLSKGIVGTMSSDSIGGGGVTMIVAIIAICLAIILLIVKVIVFALLAVLFVASPLAISLWPIEEMSWMLRSLIQAMMALLMFPVVWALCFGTFAVLNADALFPGKQAEFIDKITGPLVVLAVLIVAFRLPFAFLRIASQAGVSPGIVHSGASRVSSVASSIPTGRFSKPTPRMKG